GSVWLTVIPATPQPLQLANISVGKDLQTAMTVRVSAPANTEATISIADPSLALLSDGPLVAGQPEIPVRILNGSELGFYVQGLKAAGETKLRVQIPGAGTAESTVTLGPSGFAFASALFNITF